MLHPGNTLGASIPIGSPSLRIIVWMINSMLNVGYMFSSKSFVTVEFYGDHKAVTK